MRFVKDLTGNKTKAARMTANLLSFSPIQKTGRLNQTCSKVRHVQYVHVLLKPLHIIAEEFTLFVFLLFGINVFVIN
jgi:hypothetical protein